jgi:2-polyprenyl-3-methyl-5-hydroxy-6-metoxy-1,4-benzoquinol methylase
MNTEIILRDNILLQDNIFVGEGTSPYSDVGAYEEQQILAQLQGADWRDVVAQWYAEARPWLYQIITNPRRSAALNLLDLESAQECLDVGSGWGQLAIPLARQAQVHALDQTISRVRILREIARQESVHLQYCVGDFLTFPFRPGSFDLIVMNGSLEYMGLGHETPAWDCQLTAMRRAKELLKPMGQLYIGIENALGLKYLMGAPDDHTGVPYEFLTEKLERSNQIAIWPLSQYLKLFDLAGLANIETYACFPDYKIPEFIVPLAHIDGFIRANWQTLPEHSGLDGSTLPMLNETRRAHRLLAQEEVSRHFVPSFGFVLSKH